MTSHSQSSIQSSLLTATLAVLVTVLFVLSLMTGPADFSPRTVITALFSDQGVASIIVRDIRLPRTILALMIGATFGLAGASLQGLLRNPLAEPSLFGAPQSAAFGAVLVIAFGLADVRSYALLIAAVGFLSASLAIWARPDAHETCSEERGAACRPRRPGGSLLLHDRHVVVGRHRDRGVQIVEAGVGGGEAHAVLRGGPRRRRSGGRVPSVGSKLQHRLKEEAGSFGQVARGCDRPHRCRSCPSPFPS